MENVCLDALKIEEISELTFSGPLPACIGQAMKNLFDRSPAENFRKVMRRFQATCRTRQQHCFFLGADGLLLKFIMLPLRLLQAIERKSPSSPNYPHGNSQVPENFPKIWDDLAAAQCSLAVVQALKWRIRKMAVT